VPVAADQVVKVFLPRGSGDKIAGKIVYDGPIVPPVEKGAVLARLKLTRGTAQVLDIPLRATEDVPAGTLPRRAMDASLEAASQLWRKYVVKK